LHFIRRGLCLADDIDSHDRRLLDQIASISGPDAVNFSKARPVLTCGD
jgi:hypothetical protein